MFTDMVKVDFFPAFFSCSKLCSQLSLRNNIVIDSLHKTRSAFSAIVCDAPIKTAQFLYINSLPFLNKHLLGRDISKLHITKTIFAIKSRAAFANLEIPKHWTLVIPLSEPDQKQFHFPALRKLQDSGSTECTNVENFMYFRIQMNGKILIFSYF